MTVDLARLQTLAEAATPGPWEAGDVWLRAGVMSERFGEGKCAFCARNGEPVWVGQDDINGRKMLAHLHRSDGVRGEEHVISSARGGRVAGNYDYEEGGIIDPRDTEFIAAADPVTVLQLVRIAKAALYLEENSLRLRPEYRDPDSPFELLSEALASLAPEKESN